MEKHGDDDALIPRNRRSRPMVTRAPTRYKCWPMFHFYDRLTFTKRYSTSLERPVVSEQVLRAHKLFSFLILILETTVRYGRAMDILLDCSLHDGNDNSSDSKTMLHNKLSTGGEAVESTCWTIKLFWGSRRAAVTSGIPKFIKSFKSCWIIQQFIW